MKLVFMIMVLLSVSSAQSQKTYTKIEELFIKAVTGYEKETVICIEKQKDSYILLEFPSTKYLLAPVGYVDEVWTCEDGNWLSLGSEKDAY